MRYAYIGGPRDGEVVERDDKPQVEVVVEPTTGAASVNLLGWYYPTDDRAEGTMPMRFQAGAGRGPTYLVPHDIDDVLYAQLDAQLRESGLRGIARAPESEGDLGWHQYRRRGEKPSE